MSITEQFVRSPTKLVMLELPLPVSTNRIWMGNGSGAMRKTSTYRRWIRDAGFALNEQNPGCVHGRYRITIEVKKQHPRKHGDLGNFEKAISDLLETHGVIQNDRLAQEIVLRWNNDIDGCRVTVTPEAADKQRLRSETHAPYEVDV